MDINWSEPGPWIVVGVACFMVIAVCATIVDIMSNANEGKRLRLREREIDELTKDD